MRVHSPTVQVPRANLRDKNCYWKQCDDSETFTKIVRMLQEAELDARWRLEAGDHEEVATELVNFAAARPHAHLLGFPTPRILQDLRMAPRGAEPPAEERPSGSGTRSDVIG